MNEPTRILVVDDNEDLRHTFSLVLKRNGYHVDTAEDGVSAVDKFKAQHFDVALMDIIMPRMNGVEAFKQIKEISPGVKVILMTAYSEDALVKIALGEGARCVVHKPLRVDHIMELIRQAAFSHLILIIDDDEDIRCTLARALEGEGYRVLTARSGEEALRTARQNACHIAFIDIKLPLMNGLETYLRLKEVNPGLLAIMMTGYREEVDYLIEQALAASAHACLYKPFDPVEALGVLTQLDEKSKGGEGRDG